MSGTRIKLTLITLLLLYSVIWAISGSFASDNVITVPDDYTKIQWAIDNATAGDTIIVRDGNYSVYLNISKSITLRSENGTANCIIEASTNDDVIEVHADYVNISGFTIKNGQDDGIDVEYSDYVNISNNVFYNLSGGIQLENSNFSVVVNNNITDVSNGIYFIDSYHNLIVNNTISNSGIGIETGGSESEIYFNKFINNQYSAVECGDNNWNSTTSQTYTYQGNQFTNYTGNYWDGYTGSDMNNDGIGDIPYDIPSLMDIWGEGCYSDSYDYYPMLFESEIPPGISNIQESGLTNTSITISWQTSMTADNRILYSLNSNLSSGMWSGWDNDTQSPSITLTELNGNTTYYYSVFSYRTDNASSYSNSSIRNFTTTRNPKTWVVDDNGAECPSANFTNIHDAVNASIDGDTIIVCNGTYAGNITVDKSLNITGIGRPLINAFNVGSGFVLSSDDNIIQGFTIDRAGWYDLGVSQSDYNYGVYLLSASDGNTIRDNNFTNGGGIYISSNNNNVIQNYFKNSSVIIENTWINGGRYNNIENNEFYCSDSDFAYPLIWVKNKFSSDIITFNRIENNTINRTTQSSFATVYIDDHMERNTISGNTIKGNIAIRVDSDNNQIINNTLRGLEGLPLSTDVGIKLSYAKNCVVNNNTVELYNYGIYLIPSETPYLSFRTNLTMSNNRLSNNTYHFYIYLPPDADTLSPTFNSFDNNITSTNIIVDGGEEKKIYYLKNQSDTIFNYSDVAFFACINCDNISVRFLTPEDNSHGILLFNTTDSRIENVIVSDNAIAGAAIYYSDNITIEDSYFYNNGEDGTDSIGLYFQKTDNSLINDTEVETNWCGGLKFDFSNNNTVQNSNFTDNGPAYYLSPINEDCGAGKGISFDKSNNNTVKGSYVLATSIPEQGSWRGGQKYGIHLYSSNNNTIYNNYFNNTINACDSGFNSWNISKTSGMSIIGGPYLGGNYWHDYAGMDTAGSDGLGDTLLPYNSSGNITSGGDYHPLTSVILDETPPAIFVVSPAEGQSYSANYVHLKVYSPDLDVNSWWYSLNSGANVTFTPNTTISGLSNGDYELKVYVNDTSGNVNSTTVNFTISISSPPPSGGGGSYGYVSVQTPLEEVTEPEFSIKIISPEAESYTDRFLTLSFVSPYPLKSASYILDGSSPVMISLPSYAKEGSVKIGRLSIGEHRIIVNGEDYYGMLGKGEVEFEIIPVTLGELNVAGTDTTPRFVDDITFSFYGRNADYILKFEAKGEAKMDVYINKFCRDGVQQYGSLSASKIYSFKPTSIYQSYEVPVSAENITPDVENVISFITENAGNGEKSWKLRNTSLMPSMRFSFPQITVFTFDKVISENESMSAYLRIDGVMEEGYTAYIYLLTPEGRRLFYPHWLEDEEPISSYYLTTNYYGRLPSTLKFSNFTDGTYILVGKIVDSLNSTVSLSTDKIYYSNKNSVKLYVNREIFSEGQEILVEHMLTGNATMNGTLIVYLENPDGEVIYLPMLSEKQKGKEYNPIESDYFVAFDEIVSNWKEGTYILRSNLYSESGGLLDDDILTFEVCRNVSSLRGSYLRKVEDNDNSFIVLSRIRLIDLYTLEMEEFEFNGDHYGYSITAKPGKYYITGEAYSRKGKAYRIPLAEVFVGCGKSKTRNLELEYLFEADLTSMGLESLRHSLSNPKYIESIYKFPNSLKLEGEDITCSKPKVGVIVKLDNEDALNMLRDDINLLYGQEGYVNANKERIEGYFAIKVVELLRSQSPGLEVYNFGEILGVIDQTAGRTGYDLSRISASIVPDYIYSVSISGDMTHYFVSGKLIGIPGYIIINPTFFSSSFISDPMNEIGKAISRTGNLKPIIDNFEINHPVPPRDPKLEISVVPESVSPDSSETRKAIINAMVTDCRGVPAVELSEFGYGVMRRQEVYFQKYTDRGEIKADWEATKVSMYGGGNREILRAENWVIGDTREGGIAKAEYTLKKGIEAGEDTIKIVTFGRGMKKAVVTAKIKISGIKIEIKAEKDEISPRQDTDLYISLYKEDKDGRRTPLIGKSIEVGKDNLLDGKIVVTGDADVYGNPATDNEGKALIKYIAGKKVGIVKISVKYQTDFGEVKDVAYIKVKKEEFVIKIRWGEEYSYYHEYHRKRTCGEPLNEVKEGRYSLSFESKIIWDRGSEREVSSASVRYKEDAKGNWDGRLCGETYYVCPGQSPPIANCADWWEEEKEVWWQRNADIYSNLEDKKSFRSILKEGKAGELFINIDPLKLGMNLKGHLTGTVDGTWVTKKNGDVVKTIPLEGDVVYDFNGVRYFPAPPKFLWCLPASYPDPEVRLYYSCTYFTPNDFPDEYIRLDKLGKNSYSSFHFTYPVKIDVEGYSIFYDAEYRTKLEGIKEMHVTVVKR